MAVAVDVAIVRSILGVTAAWWSDTQITDPSITVPAVMALETLCPSVYLLSDSEDEDAANIALANLVAAGLMRQAPDIASSRMGDTTVTFPDNWWSDRTARFEEQAKKLMSIVCPMPAPSVNVFRTAPGRRGE